MARKKKTEVKIIKEEPVKKVETKKKLKYNPGAGEVFWLDYSEVPGTVLGALYEFKDNVKARLVYLGEKAKFIIE